MANTRKKWATKEAAKGYALRAEKTNNMGLTYCAACDFLGWDVAARREAREIERRKALKLSASKRH